MKLSKHALKRIHRLEQRRAELKDNPDPHNADIYRKLETMHHIMLDLEQVRDYLVGSD